MIRPKALVFLGNPGKEYAHTRHNVGFMVASHWPLTRALSWQVKFKGEWASLILGGQRIPVLKPSTFMNLSGESVQALGAFLKIAPTDWLVVHDDIDLSFGELRLQTGGGLGGHNGLRSIKQALATNDFHRLRIGIGRPVHGDVASFVLGRFTPDEEGELSRTLDRANALLEATFSAGVAGA